MLIIADRYNVIDDDRQKQSNADIGQDRTNKMQLWRCYHIQKLCVKTDQIMKLISKYQN